MRSRSAVKGRGVLAVIRDLSFDREIPDRLQREDVRASSRPASSQSRSHSRP